MNRSVLFCWLILLAACGRSNEQPISLASESQEVSSICSLAEISKTKDGERVHIRGRMLADAHDVFLTGPKCSDAMLVLKTVPNGPDVTLCDSETLANKFGCPGGNASGPMVTVTGVLRASANPQIAAISVESMSNFRTLGEESLK